MSSPLDMQTRLLGAYGKLPSARDFVRFGTQSAASIGVRSMLDAGAAAVIAGRDRGAHELRFVRCAKREQGLVAGTIWPSSDQGGLRAYPFTVFEVFPELAANDGVFTFLEGRHRFHRGLFADCRGAADLGEVRELLEAGGESVLSAPEPRRVVGGGVAAWLRSVFDESEDALLLGLWRLRLLARSSHGRLAGLLPERRGFVLPPWRG